MCTKKSIHFFNIGISILSQAWRACSERCFTAGTIRQLLFHDHCTYNIIIFLCAYHRIYRGNIRKRIYILFYKNILKYIQQGNFLIFKMLCVCCYELKSNLENMKDFKTFDKHHIIKTSPFEYQQTHE